MLFKSLVLALAAGLTTAADITKDDNNYIRYSSVERIAYTGKEFTVAKNGKPAELCAITEDKSKIGLSQYDAPGTNDCTTFEAKYPNKEEGDVAEFTFTPPKGFKTTMDMKVTHAQLRLCWAPAVSTLQRAWRTVDYKPGTDVADRNPRPGREKSCAKIVKDGDKEKIEVSNDGSKITWTWKVPQNMPDGFLYPTVQFYCEGEEADSYKPKGLCAYWKAQEQIEGTEFYNSYSIRTVGIDISRISKVVVPLAILIPLGPLFLCGYMTYDKVLKKKD